MTVPFGGVGARRRRGIANPAVAEREVARGDLADEGELERLLAVVLDAAQKVAVLLQRVRRLVGVARVVALQLPLVLQRGEGVGRVEEPDVHCRLLLFVVCVSVGVWPSAHLPQERRVGRRPRRSPRRPSELSHCSRSCQCSVQRLLRVEARHHDVGRVVIRPLELVEHHAAVEAVEPRPVQDHGEPLRDALRRQHELPLSVEERVLVDGELEVYCPREDATAVLPPPEPRDGHEDRHAARRLRDGLRDRRLDVRPVLDDDRDAVVCAENLVVPDEGGERVRVGAENRVERNRVIHYAVPPEKYLATHSSIASCAVRRIVSASGSIVASRFWNTFSFST